MNKGGSLTREQLHQAIERAQERVHAARPGDEELAHRWLKAFRTRLEKAELTGERA